MFHACSRCKAPRLLLARVLKEMLCAACYKAAGEPAPSPIDEKDRREAIERNEAAIREKMLKAGGEQRYRVQSGKS